MISDDETTARFCRAMGSDCEFHLCFENTSDSQFVFKCMLDELERLESKYSRFRKDSLLSQINLTADQGEEINCALSVTDFTKVSWTNGLLSMPVGMNLDFGGIVKEYAADTLAVLAKKLGVKYGL